MKPFKELTFLAPRRSAAGGGDGWFDVAFGKAARRAGVRAVVLQPVNAVAVLGRVLRRAGLVRHVAHLSQRAYLVTLPQISEYKLLPATYFSEIVPYVYDCWPYRWAEWERFFGRHEIRVAFFSASQTRDYFEDRLPTVECIWMPEACDPEVYDRGKPLAERSIDLNEFGRRNEVYHDAIAAGLATDGRRHSTAFTPDRAAFLRRLSDSKVCVCFPSSVTNPEWAGELETVTLRYFECMASGSLLIGHCPRDLHTLFGFNPVLEVDPGRPLAQVREVLASVETYQAMVDRNYQRLCEVGTWDARIGSMLDLLKQRGYAASGVNPG